MQPFPAFFQNFQTSFTRYISERTSYPHAIMAHNASKTCFGSLQSTLTVPEMPDELCVKCMYDRPQPMAYELYCHSGNLIFCPDDTKAWVFFYTDLLTKQGNCIGSTVDRVPTMAV